MHRSRLQNAAAAATAAPPSAGHRPKRSTTVSSASPSRRTPATTPSSSLPPVVPSRSVSQGVPHGRTATSSVSLTTQRGAPQRTARPSSSVAPTMEEAATVVSATAAAKDTGVSLSKFAHDGERFEPNTYETTFRFRGDYGHVALAESTATLWCANEGSGAMDLYSCVTGQFIASLPTLSEEVRARQAELSELPINTAPSTTASGKNSSGTAVAAVGSKATGQGVTTVRGRGLVPLAAGGAVASPAARHRFSSPPWSCVPATDVTPSSLRATAAHMWVGYTDGTVAVYDTLLLKLVTMGQFHSSPVTALAVLRNGQVVSASADGLLVLWDTEAAGFEAVTRVTVLLDAVRAGAGRLCAMTATSHAARVCCGFASGEVYSVVVANRPQEQTPAYAMKAHTSQVSDMAAVRELLFTAAEDNSVCVWYCGNASSSSGQGSAVPGLSSDPSGNPHAFAGAPQGPLAIRALHAATKLMKRITVKPCVRALLSEETTRSVWVAYADGLLERWSANPNDDFGVEEVVDNAMVTEAAAANPTDGRSTSAATAEVAKAGNGGVAATRVRALLSLSAVQTMQWLALSSNGVNKVWYGHKNTLEINLANSLLALHDVIAQDAEDAAAWKEKVNVLKLKEMERKSRYVCILEQLNEQRVLQRHYNRWRQSLLFCGVRRRCTAALAATLESRTQVQLTRRFFGKWAAFYDAQQRHMRGYVLAMALSRVTERQQLQMCFVAWEAFLVKRRIRRTAQVSAAVMSSMNSTACLSSFFHQWRAAVPRKARHHACLSDEHLALLAHKAQRQVQQRVLRQWMSYHAAQKQQRRSLLPSDKTAAGAKSEVSALSTFAAHYARLQQQRQARQVLQMWRRWTGKRSHYASLAAIAALREQQLLYEARQNFFLRWRQRVHARRTSENAEQLKALEMKLRRAEAEHGDIFEKLQLQRQLDQLASRQAAEEAQLSHTKSQLAALEQSCAQLRAQQQERKHDPAHLSNTPHTQHQATRGGSDVGSNATSSFPRLPGVDVTGDSSTGRSASLVTGGSDGPGGGNGSGSGRGHMAANAVFYRSLVDQQRLSPIVLAHMPVEEAVRHVMGQLKGNVVNLYTDLALFRQVKDRRRAGTSAVGILLEAFGELKRMIVSTVPGASTAAASAAARSGVKATRWPLSMEALDCIPVHQCSNVLSAIKTIVVAYDLLQPEDVPGVQSTCEEVVANADWVFLMARACYLRRKPLPPANNRQVA
ncbi:hypothetical protein ABB37_01966 [Leptomonas pyrrhocoris]|uniref:Uncharacterized protein n=1 Tax=Leptomonas pyrrhocoris TaxID=157538 RepID=A0A0M9G6X3_LEPPY|nr:hypothetical protein ABB37_01966 [Leptomonas pyrrhocoris]XP_015662157.1 hypothetical protein ABB37_01966 [Leptomonas pyrrhocoris]KPA83717.1 hypothetical protein ABB37_01966 [Leptomonas pyrrhocoris]KPA83718.1 hypothetical protein ABB37_01966 [Leptomonas pyrrhocoris]|eukprot:XP_015662156.1 hypothetical protein ABB37_01966 [Leptomonas pyrrhocoris]